jgi:hypothetical protein
VVGDRCGGGPPPSHRFESAIDYLQERHKITCRYKSVGTSFDYSKTLLIEIPKDVYGAHWLRASTASTFRLILDLKR